MPLLDQQNENIDTANTFGQLLLFLLIGLGIGFNLAMTFYDEIMQFI